MILEKLTELDIEMMDAYRFRYACHDTDVMTHAVPMVDVLDAWKRNKSEYLFKMMGEELILSKEIEIERNRQELINDMYAFTNNTRRNKAKADGSTFIRAYEDWLRTMYRGLDREENAFDWDTYCDVNSLIYSDKLVGGHYYGKQFEIPLPDGKKYRIVDGHKVMKALAKIASAYHLEGFEEFRLGHSQVLNQKMFKGNLSISIHPLDYMTMSDNACGWGSCMTWEDDGDYRRGTITMMNSPCVVVAYLEASEPMDLTQDGTYHWNNKKWRELFIIDEGVIAGVKGYPYCNRELEIEVINWLKELAAKNLGWDYLEAKEYNFRGNRSFEIEYEPDEFIEVSFTCDTMYNDFGGFHMLALSNTIDYTYHSVHYSGPDTCLACGNEWMDYDTESLLVCSDCLPVCRCYECGDIHDMNNMIEYDDNLYCRWCYEDLPRCSVCGEIDTDCADVYLALDRDHVYRTITMNLCDNCYEILRDYIHKRHQRWYWEVHFIIPEEIPEEVWSQLYDTYVIEDFLGRKVQDKQTCIENETNCFFRDWRDEEEKEEVSPQETDLWQRYILWND